jgi:hypothetical protein
MSTISIMPLGTKLRITRQTEILHSQLLSGSERLVDAGYILGKKLLLEEGCHIRFEGFKAFATAKDYPDVKLTVYPIEGKSASLYVSMEHLDGLSWEPVKEDKQEEKKTTPPSRRYDVDITRNQVDFRWVYHNEVFENRYDSETPEWVLINPLKLKPEERNLGFFKEDLNDIGEAILTDVDRRKYQFTIGVKLVYQFETSIHNEGVNKGLLSARCCNRKAILIIYPRYDRHKMAEICPIELGQTDVVTEVKAWMKKYNT